MDYRTKLTTINLGIWLLFFTMFILVFFNTFHLVDLESESTRYLVSAILFLLANISNTIMLVKSRKEKDDERYKRFEHLSSTATMIIVMMYVFLLCIGFYVKYEDTGTMPVSLIWFVAFSSAYVTFVSFNLSYIIVSLKGTGYESF